MEPDARYDRALIRAAQYVLLESIIDLFTNPPAEMGPAEDLRLSPFQIAEMLQFTDSQLAELDDETLHRIVVANRTDPIDIAADNLYDRFNKRHTK